MAHKNEISATLAANVKQSIKGLYDTILQKLPFAIDLDEEERKSGQKIGPKRRDSADFMLRVCNDHPDILPATFKIQEFEKDSILETQMLDVMTWSARVHETISDTHLLVGKEKYAAALKVYEYLKAAQGLEELKKEAAEYFKRAKEEEEEEEEEETVTPPTPA